MASLPNLLYISPFKFRKPIPVGVGKFRYCPLMKGTLDQTFTVWLDSHSTFLLFITFCQIHPHALLGPNVDFTHSQQPFLLLPPLFQVFNFLVLLQWYLWQPLASTVCSHALWTLMDFFRMSSYNNSYGSLCPLLLPMSLGFFISISAGYIFWLLPQSIHGQL